MSPHKSVICNTTLLSNFAFIERLDLLPLCLGQSLFTVPQVVDEISAGVSAGYKHLILLERQLLSGSSPFTVLSLSTSELAIALEFRLRLHAGEASCLATALERACTFGTDDLAARKVARARRVPVIGTLGALSQCRHGLLSLEQANQLLRRLIDAGYRSPLPVLDSLWK